MTPRPAVQWLPDVARERIDKQDEPLKGERQAVERHAVESQAVENQAVENQNGENQDGENQPVDSQHGANQAPRATVSAARALDWVGMQGIAVPLLLAGGAGAPIMAPAEVDIFVDLCDPQARGIHMSRLYLRLQHALAGESPLPGRLHDVLRDCIESQDALSTAARLALRYEQMVERPALASAHRGWKRYPLQIEATLDARGFALALAFSLEYSSTCPASAALSRQLNADRFAETFSAAHSASTQAIRDWLASERGLAATPHAQRSRAEIRLELSSVDGELPVVDFIDRAEAALATPVQTAVKREDEQAFARLNAENLMFCEDAARRLAAIWAADHRVSRFELRVAHYESLHPHDAVAQISGRGGGAS